MPDEERRCEHPYYEWDADENGFVEKQCPHPYFGPGVSSDMGKEIDCCVFHAAEGRFLYNVKRVGVEEFWNEFEKLFDRAKDAVEKAKTEVEKKNVWLECYGFVFPDIGDRFHRREFPFSVNMCYTEFFGATDFSGALFSGVAYFWGVQFSGDTYSPSHADFSGAIFSGDAYFWGAHFSPDGNADFSRATFSGSAYFSEVWFSGHTIFSRARFSGVAYFWGARFSGDADFSEAQFKENVTFRITSVTGKVGFGETEFLKNADFRGIHACKLEFEREVLEHGKLLLWYAYFHCPERVSIGGKAIYGSDISRWSFCGTNIEEIRFVEPCWPEEKARRGRKKTLDEERAGKGEISWAEAGEVYRKLRKNFEDNLAYEAAGDFHVGQMECRLRDRNRKPWDRALTFAYKLISGYGESVGRPFLWLLGFFTLFTGLFLITGFPASDGSVVNWTWGFKGFLSREWSGQLWQGISFTLRSSISFAVPRYAEGVDAKVGATLPVLMFFWKAFAVTIVTFFVLALRRRFRR